MTGVASLLPPNATQLERSIEQATARVGQVPTPVGDLWNPAACPSAFLPWLAWAVSVDTWDSSWTDDVKRQVILASPAVHRRKGTAQAVKDAIGAFGTPLTLTPWFQQDPPGAPYTFEIAIDVLAQPGQATAAFADQVIAAVDAAKAERDHFTFIQSASAEIDLSAVMYARPLTYARLEMTQS
jgi:phage tail P2-like protein